MRDRAQVISIKDGDIKIMPLISDVCINCDKAICAKRGKSFSVSNPKKLPVKCGDIVKVSSSLPHQILQALFALVFPVLCGVAGYIYFPGGEGAKAAAVTVCFALGALVVFVVTHFLPPLKSIIADVLSA
ncbi:MAG: SoxR reducing system RseC family protein [Treponemataceae bacterium]|nr:SoxR reducing system RseC family protein [Treponemataceae bacterium]